MSSPAPRRAEVYLPPGLLHATAEPCVISTVLGSCVSVCLWSARARVGGMNHFVLARGAEPEGSPRFGEPALDLLLARLHGLGVATRELEARIYGGAAVLAGLTSGTRLGTENVNLARRWVLDHSLPVVAEDVLGQVARRVHFDVATGDATVTRLGMR